MCFKQFIIFQQKCTCIGESKTHLFPYFPDRFKIFQDLWYGQSESFDTREKPRERWCYKTGMLIGDDYIPLIMVDCTNYSFEISLGC